MTKPSARRAALAALRTWRKERGRADAIIGALLTDTQLSTADRAFALELFYGVLRNLSLLDFWIGCLRSGNLEIHLRDILQLGLYQLLIANVPEHAAVNESVGLAPQSRRGFINGILRAAGRTRNELLAQAKKQPLSVQTSHPAFLIERWQGRYGSNATIALCHWNNSPPPIYARINRLKTDRDKIIRDLPGARPLSQNQSFVECSIFPKEALNRGFVYIQDPSTALACALLDPQPGETILDACAAPGGKTCHLAELMENRGVLVSCDREPKRLAILRENTRRLGVTIVNICQCDWMTKRIPSEATPQKSFDRILVDVPCTNTGVMRRRVDVRWRLGPGEFLRMKKQQVAIVRTLIPLLKPGGVLVYSTCSLEPEENEDVVQSLLDEIPLLKLQQQEFSLPFRDHFDGAFAAKFIKT